MQVQKKRNSARKQKNNKYEMEATMPIGSLMNEISELKGQLAEIKSKKSSNRKQKDLSSYRLQEHASHFGEDPFEDSSTSVKDKRLEKARSLKCQDFFKNIQAVGSSPKSFLADQSKTMSRFQTGGKQFSLDSLHEVRFPIREHELKLNIEFNKLYRYMKSVPGELSSILSEQLNRTIDFYNRFIEELSELHSYDKQDKILPLQLEEMLAQQQKKSETYYQINRQLQREVIELKHALAMETDCAVVTREESDELYQTNLQLISKQEEIMKELENQRIIYKGAKDDRQRLEEKLRVFEQAVQQKQEQILVLEEDIAYNRQQSEKHRTQKKELERCYQEISEDYKMLKKKYESEVEMVKKQKQRWKKECESRRFEETELLAQQEHKNALKKELQEMRRQNLLKNTECNEVKSKLHEEQRRNITLQGQNYQIATENEKLKRGISFCKQEMKDMAEQVEEMRKYMDRNRTKNPKVQKSVKKSQALDQIRQLIHGHRREVLDENDS